MICYWIDSADMQRYLQRESMQLDESSINFVKFFLNSCILWICNVEHDVHEPETQRNMMFIWTTKF